MNVWLKCHEKQDPIPNDSLIQETSNGLSQVKRKNDVDISFC